jgi:hypothetical protein
LVIIVNTTTPHVADDGCSEKEAYGVEFLLTSENAISDWEAAVVFANPAVDV